MAMTELCIENLDQLDEGIVNAGFKQATQRAIKDCFDRPNENKPRTVTLTITFKPVMDQRTRELEQVATGFDIKESVPKRSTKTYLLDPRKNGSLVFSTTNPENADQLALEDKHPGFQNNEG